MAYNQKTEQAIKKSSKKLITVTPHSQFIYFV